MEKLGLATGQAADLQRLAEVMEDELKPRSREAWMASMATFARHLGALDIPSASRALLVAGPSAGNAMVLGFLKVEEARGMGPSTLRLRHWALGRTVRWGRILGFCTWRLEVKPPKAVAYRDTRGPGVDGVAAMFRLASQRSNPRKAARDLAMLRLLYDVAMRRGEVAALRLEDVERGAAAVWILGKGRDERELLTLPAVTSATLTTWLELRGTAPGPLFFRLDPGLDRAALEPLTGRAIWGIVHQLGEELDLDRARPHGFRHSSITRVLELTGGNYDQAMAHARHKSISTTQIYNDNRLRVAAGATDLLTADMARLA